MYVYKNISLFNDVWKFSTTTFTTLLQPILRLLIASSNLHRRLSKVSSLLLVQKSPFPCNSFDVVSPFKDERSPRELSALLKAAVCLAELWRDSWFLAGQRMTEVSSWRARRYPRRISLCDTRSKHLPRQIRNGLCATFAICEIRRATLFVWKVYENSV